MSEAAAERIVLAEPARTPTCISCSRLIVPWERGVAFLCPNCGEVVIWRCPKCRRMGVPYRCPKCGFEGP